MRLSPFLPLLAIAPQTISGASLPDSKNALHILEDRADSAPRAADIVSPDHTLERRKGGGGRGGGSSGGSSGGSRSSGGGGGSSPRTNANSNAGGATSRGSGPSRSYGGGYYGGGAAVPYAAGGRSRKGLVAGALILPAAALALMPGIWLWSVYPYYYNNPYRFYNRTAVNETNNNNNLDKRQNQQGQNQTLPVVCLCQEYSVCGCDENNDQKYLDDLIGNGSYAALNKSLVTVSQHNGERTLVLNGTLPNGTTAPGGVDENAASTAFGLYTGFWAMGLVVLYGVFL